MSHISRLESYLHELGTGRLRRDRKLIELLAQAWDELEGSDATKMKAEKLDRIEDILWQPPCLTFSIERHGAMEMGSTRATMHTWEVNFIAKKASIITETRRQKEKQDTRFDAEAAAVEVAKLIRSHADDRKITWTSDVGGQLNIEQIVSATFKQTTQARRKRFRAALVKELAEDGWTVDERNRFKKSTP